MDKFIEGLTSVVQPPWNYVLGVAALLIVAIPRLMELRQNFLDVRMGRRQLELEKLRLEVLKLRMEVQQLRERPEFPGLAPELETVPPAAAKPSVPPPEPRGGLRGLLSRHPRFGRPVMLLVQFFLAYLMTIFAVGAVGIPVVGWADPDLGPGLSIVLAIFYAAIAWLSYKGFAAARSIRKELLAR